MAENHQDLDYLLKRAIFGVLSVSEKELRHAQALETAGKIRYISYDHTINRWVYEVRRTAPRANP